MLKTKILHPEILSALGRSGHGSKVLVADGNYPFSTQVNGDADIVYLNLAPGVVSVPQVLSAIQGTVVIERVEVAAPEEGEEPSIFKEFRDLLGGLNLKKRGRFDFYESAKDDQLSLAIATGEQRIFSCIILTLGVVTK